MFQDIPLYSLPSSDSQPDPGAGCLGSLIGIILAFILCALLSLLTSSCTTQREIISTLDHHSVETLMQRMDSVIASRTVVEQDSAWRQLIMRQFQSLHEKNDTSHTVVVDTAGRVVKETLIIRTERESASETDRTEREVLIHRLSVMDSTLAVMQQQIHHSDSLLQQERQTEIKEVPAKLSRWQQFQIWLGRIILLALAAALAVWLLKKRAWWLRLFK